MAKTLKAVRGMRDTLPLQVQQYQRIESHIRALMRSYDYDEVRLPILEPTELFKRSVGEETDIVGKEMYSFLSRSDESLTLRPEGTAGCMRAGIEHGAFYNQTQKWWYLGPMFRYERPQKGRYRQFHQWGVEVVGIEGPSIEAEIIQLCARLWQALGLQDAITLQINSLGTLDCRLRYRTLLKTHFKRANDQLSDDEKERLERNPLRLLDSKNPVLAELIASAPKLHDHLSDNAKAKYDTFAQMLTDSGIAFTHNPHLVRGLDYYQHTVFEWVTDALGAQNAVAAGGRYDGLVEQLGGHPTSAVGFAMGMERIAEMLGEDRHHKQVDVGVFILDESVVRPAFAWVESLRSLLGEQVIIAADHQGGSLKSQHKRADRMNARFTLFIDGESWAKQSLLVRSVNNKSAPKAISCDGIAAWLLQQLTQEDA